MIWFDEDINHYSHWHIPSHQDWTSPTNYRTTPQQSQWALNLQRFLLTLIRSRTHLKWLIHQLRLMGREKNWPNLHPPELKWFVLGCSSPLFLGHSICFFSLFRLSVLSGAYLLLGGTMGVSVLCWPESGKNIMYVSRTLLGTIPLCNISITMWWSNF